MRPLIITTTVAVAVIGTLAGTAGVAADTQGSRDDARATRLYVDARYAYVQEVKAHLRAGRMALAEFTRNVNRQCAHVLVDAPASDMDEFEREVIAASVVVMLRPDRVATLRVSAVSKAVRWRSRRVNALVDGLSTKERRIVNVVPPPLCRDARAWKVSGFDTLPPTGKRFLIRWAAARGGKPQNEAVVLRLIISYANREGKAIVRHLLREGSTIQQPVARLLGAEIARLNVVLGLSTRVSQ